MAEAGRVGILVPNLFLRIPVESAVRSAGVESVALAATDVVTRAACRVVIVDLDALPRDPGAAILRWVRSGLVVLGFGPHVDATRLAAARHAGAVVLPRAAFMARLPELLASALATAGVTARPAASEASNDEDERT